MLACQNMSRLTRASALQQINRQSFGNKNILNSSSDVDVNSTRNTWWKNLSDNDRQRLLINSKINPNSFNRLNSESNVSEDEDPEWWRNISGNVSLPVKLKNVTEKEDNDNENIFEEQASQLETDESGIEYIPKKSIFASQEVQRSQRSRYSHAFNVPKIDKTTHQDLIIEQDGKYSSPARNRSFKARKSNSSKGSEVPIDKKAIDVAAYQLISDDDTHISSIPSINVPDEVKHPLFRCKARKSLYSMKQGQKFVEQCEEQNIKKKSKKRMRLSSSSPTDSSISKFYDESLISSTKLLINPNGSDESAKKKRVAKLRKISDITENEDVNIMENKKSEDVLSKNSQIINSERENAKRGRKSKSLVKIPTNKDTVEIEKNKLNSSKLNSTISENFHLVKNTAEQNTEIGEINRETNFPSQKRKKSKFSVGISQVSAKNTSKRGKQYSGSMPNTEINEIDQTPCKTIKEPLEHLLTPKRINEIEQKKILSKIPRKLSSLINAPERTRAPESTKLKNISFEALEASSSFENNEDEDHSDIMLTPVANYKIKRKRLTKKSKSTINKEFQSSQNSIISIKSSDINDRSNRTEQIKNWLSTSIMSNNEDEDHSEIMSPVANLNIKRKRLTKKSKSTINKEFQSSENSIISTRSSDINEKSNRTEQIKNWLSTSVMANNARFTRASASQQINRQSFGNKNILNSSSDVDVNSTRNTWWKNLSDNDRQRLLINSKINPNNFNRLNSESNVSEDEDPEWWRNISGNVSLPVKLKNVTEKEDNDNENIFEEQASQLETDESGIEYIPKKSIFASQEVQRSQRSRYSHAFNVPKIDKTTHQDLIIEQDGKYSSPARNRSFKARKSNSSKGSEVPIDKKAIDVTAYQLISDDEEIKNWLSTSVMANNAQSEEIQYEKKYILNSSNILTAKRDTDTSLSEEEILRRTKILKATKVLPREPKKSPLKVHTRKMIDSFKKLDKEEKLKPIPKNTKIVKEVSRPVCTARLIDGKPYYKKKLFAPERWCSQRFYKYLQNKMKDKYKRDTINESENLMKCIVQHVKSVIKSKKYLKEEVDKFKIELAEKNIISTNYDFSCFCFDYLPIEYQILVVPITQAFTSEPTVPYKEEDVFKKIIV